MTRYRARIQYMPSMSVLPEHARTHRERDVHDPERKRVVRMLQSDPRWIEARRLLDELKAEYATTLYDAPEA